MYFYRTPLNMLSVRRLGLRDDASAATRKPKQGYFWHRDNGGVAS